MDVEIKESTDDTTTNTYACGHDSSSPGNEGCVVVCVACDVWCVRVHVHRVTVCRTCVCVCVCVCVWMGVMCVACYVFVHMEVLPKSYIADRILMVHKVVIGLWWGSQDMRGEIE